MTDRIVAIVYNTAFYVYKFRINLIKELQSQGYRVVVVSPYDDYVVELRSLGIEHYNINMSQYGMNPIKELLTTLEIYRFFQKCQPICSLHYTIKPNIFGGIAAALAGVPVICNIAGAGRAFSDGRSILSHFISPLYRLGLSRASKVFFQNLDDLTLFTERGLVTSDIAERIPGSGVDLSRFSVSQSETKEGVFRFLFVGRLLKEKGVLEYLNAAKEVVESLGNKLVEFEIVGELDDTGACIERLVLEKFLESPNIKYLGAVSPVHMPDIVRRASCVVLPSYYREGIPRSLLEAAAMGKPIITTNNVGCRDVVEDGINGYMIPVRDVDALTGAMRDMINLPITERLQMGQSGRQKIELEFDEKFVLEAYRKAIAEVVNCTFRQDDIDANLS
ncbi:MAG: glycosyltransferase family 4 protein [Pseudomonadota bacterium]